MYLSNGFLVGSVCSGSQSHTGLKECLKFLGDSKHGIFNKTENMKESDRKHGRIKQKTWKNQTGNIDKSDRKHGRIRQKPGLFLSQGFYK